MGFQDEYTKLRQKRLREEQERQEAENRSFNGAIAALQNTDIAPVISQQRQEEENERTWFQKGAFEDGYQFGDIVKTILGTSRDITDNVNTAVVDATENLIDTVAYGVGAVGSLFSDDFQDDVGDFIAKDFLKSEKLGKAMSLPTPDGLVSQLVLGDKTEEYSLLGERSDGLVQSGAHLVGTAALQYLGVPWWLTSGVNSFGSEIEQAYANDATHLEAGLSGAVTVGAEILTEKMFGGSGLGEKGLIDTSALTKGIANKTVKALADFGVNIATEGSEEVVSQIFSNLGSSLYKEENLEELLTSEEAVDGYIESFVGGAVLGGGANIGKVVNSVKTGRDYNTGLTENEQKVFDKVYNDRLAEAEKGGKKLTDNEKSKIYEEVMEDIDRGYISIDDIESAIGGETYKSYMDTVVEEDALRAEFDTLNKIKQGDMTGEQLDRRTELKEQLEQLKTTSNREQLKTQLGEEVFNLAKDSRLAESYNEKARRSQAFDADLTTYDAKQQEVVKKAIESGILNNTIRTHEFVDIVAKISADKGVSFDFTNNAKLKESGFAVDGASVNGVYTKDGIYINMDSHKAWQSTVGHEITHVMEGTELYAEMQKALFDYAKSKNDYQGRYDALTKLYANVKDANIEAELTADLVGDYLFTDSDFVNHLSVKHRNVFQKIYDEIKYLWKQVTAGSKEARELEKVKHAFDKAYKDGGKASTDTKYSLSDKNIKDVSTGYGYGESYYTMSYTQDGKVVGTLEYGEYDGSPNVKMVEVDPEYRRKGIGTKLLQALQNKYPDAEIDFGMSTPDGTKLLEAITYDVTDEAVVADRQKLKTLQTELDDLQGKLDALFELIDNGQDLTEAQDVELHELGDRWQDTYETIRELEKSLQGKRATKTFVKTDTKYSLSDSDGKQLTKEQSEYFKDSKMRDENGNLKVMYHGSQDAGFHVFDASMSDDDTSFFFVDRNDVAASYSGTTETYEAQTIRTAEDMNKFIESIGAEGYEVVEKDGKFTLLYEGDRVADSNTAQGIYDEFCWYEGVGEGDANYKVYLNLTNPLEIDAEGRNWNNVTREFSQELADRYNSLTAAEKDALMNLASWEDISIFRDELRQALADTETGTPGSYDADFARNVRSAYEKLGGPKVNMYDLFTIASDGFSAESINQFAVKQMNTRDYAQKAKAEGYDGVIFKNIHDNGGYSNGSEGASTVAIAFESNQIKSVANAKPTGDPDIRYSLSADSEGRQVSPAVQKRFGNTKVVDDNGNLKVVYHGTASGEFSIFDKSKGSVEGDFGSGFYFTDSDADVSEHYEGGGPDFDNKIARRAEQIEAEEDIDYDEAEERARKELYKGGHKFEVYLNIENPAIVGKTMLFTQESYLEQYDEADYGDYDEYIADCEQLLADDVENIVYEVERNTGAYSTDGLADVLYNAYYDGGIGIEELKSKINELYLEDDNGNFIGNEVARQVIESLGYDGIIDPTVSGKWNMDIEPGTTHYIVFKPNQIKAVTNQNPTDNPDIHRSLSAEGEAPVKYGNYSTPLSDLRIEKAPVQEDVAPVQEDVAKTATTTPATVSKMEQVEDLPVFDKNTSPALYNMRDGKNGWGNVYGTAQEALNNAVQSVNKELWVAIDNEIENSIGESNAHTPMTNALIAVQEDVRQQTITPMQGAHLLNDAYNIGGADALKRLYNPATGNLYAKHLEKAKQYSTVAPIQEDVSKMEQVEGYAPITEEEANTLQQESMESLTDADAPPEMEAPYYGESEALTADDPFKNRDIKAVGKRNVKAYMYENPEVKPFFQKEASIMLGELYNTTKGERFYTPTNGSLDAIAYGAESYGVWTGVSRQTTPDIEYLLDTLKYSYAQIEKGLKAIIEDNGAENNACSKRIEFLLNDRLIDGYQTTDGMPIPPDQDYINLLNEKEIREYSEEARKSFFDVADEYAPQEDIGPVTGGTTGTTTKEAYEAITPKREPSNEPRLKRVKEGEPTATYETTKASQIDGQRTMFPEGKTAQILTEEPETGKRSRNAWSMFKNNVLDKGMVFEDLSLETGNRELQARWNSIRYAEGKAQKLIGEGNANVSSLKSIQETVEQSGKTAQFYEYLYHMHNVDRMSLEGKAAPTIGALRSKFGHLKEAQIRAIAAKKITDQTTEKTANTIREAQEYLRAIETKNKPVFGDSVTAEVSQETAAKLEKANPEFKEYAREVYDYMNYLREMMVENGVISRDTAKLWSDIYPHYVPIRRAGHDGASINVPLDTGRTGVNAPIKRATGGNSDILPLFDTMALRTEQTYRAIAKNRFGVELKNTLGTTIYDEAASLDDAIDGVDTQDGLLQEGKNGNSPTFTVFEDGKKVTFEITEEMYDAIKPTGKGLSYTNKVANTVGNVFRGLLTEYNPVFMATNAVKDVQDVLINSQHATRTYAAIPKAIKQMATNGHWYQEYLSNGGEQNTYFENDTNTFKAEDKGFKKIVGMPLRAISYLNNTIEKVPRLAEYIASREAGRSIDVSMLDAARVTTNFAAGGDVTKFLNRNGFTFLNASTQGAIQQVRNVREAKANGLKGWVQLASKVALAGIPALILNNLLWDDDEEYEELSDYVKQNYYVVAKYGDGQFVRIPKGRTLAVIQNAFEQVSNGLTGDDEVDLQSFLELAISNLAPNNPLENNILAPIMQVKNNETWYGEDLVPTRLQDLPEAEQYDESTDAISKWLGEKLNYSPYKINYLLNQYSGGIGDVVLPMLTPEAESGDNSLGGNLLAPWKDKFTTNSVTNNQNVSDFYDTVDELTKTANSSTATDEDVLSYKYINSVRSELSELYKKKREIQNSDMDDAEKYEAALEIQEQINSLAREGLNTYGNVYINNGYAEVGDQHYRWYEPGEDSDAEAGWQKITDKQLEQQEEVTRGLGIDPSEYWNNKSEYDFAYENPEKYAVAKSVGGYTSYKTYSSELYDIKADKDEDGKSITGSRKEKVIDYVNGLDVDYGIRLILFKNEYNADDTYNYEIIDYLNSREDISFDEMASILKELGFDVSSDGTITWD